MSRIALFAAVALLLACPATKSNAADAYHPASNLYLTTKLKTAKPGSWVRHYAPSDNAYTTYVVDITDDTVIIQHMYTHEGRLRLNQRYEIPFSYLDEHGINPDANGARDDTITRNDQEYATRTVPGTVDGKESLFHFNDAIPATGLLCVEIHPSEEGKPILAWTDAHGLEPDELIKKLGDGKPAELP